jgi:hypothetical protein
LEVPFVFGCLHASTVAGQERNDVAYSVLLSITDSCGVEPTERDDRRDKPNAVQVSKRASEPGAGVGPDRDKQMKSRRYRRGTQSRDDRLGSWPVTMPKSQSPMIPMRPMNCESPSPLDGSMWGLGELGENPARARREPGASSARARREPIQNIHEDRLNSARARREPGAGQSRAVLEHP